MTETLPSHFEDEAHRRRTAKLGMWVFIASESLFFGALFALYFGYRAWYPDAFAQASHHANLVLGTINTYVLLTSSLAVALALAAAREGRFTFARLLVALTMLLGVAFLVLKITEYVQHGEAGVLPGHLYRSNELPGPGPLLYFTLYYGMTGLHGVHVLVGLALFSWAWAGLTPGRTTPRVLIRFELIGLYWHFVDVVWLFLWPMFYLIH